MHSVLIAFAATGLASVAQAFTKPGASTWGPLLTPDLSTPVTAGETFKITWDPETHPTDGVTVSLVLCHGPSSNCVPSDTAIVEGLPASQKSYQWSVPSDLAPGKQATDTGYGMLIIVDGTGEFQYSTQFSVLAGKGASSGSSSSGSGKPTVTASSTATDSAGNTILGPPAQQTGATSIADANPYNTTFSSGWWSTISPSGTVYSGTIPLTTYGGGSTLTTQTGSVVPAGTTIPATGVSTTATGAGVTAPTFTGAADRLGLNAASLAVAGVMALFAL
ncbi:hypothetical protein LTR84_008547 [Exophiala bonariae]|uniref:Yeast cell wall synthesis Kre9/Knh1-like N-terminal domain-containing protein n=1 Tax=Exophiala bonariae TaxID=1690606 RepID=A0AAV9MYS8_9EURO|nr:hypothetical protein LTR84_008547 [Exophiala bonariae]